ncbi:triose-phosphate transporter family-domain-containing protein [Tricharina praecox]|uniref:triose-phosphate transporter family-domain-containing protein n=1 Tax=Tricharina praecox TaxID=43433 RepID=UPI00221EFFCD|nr:triose-phosphate transporter family-domain-containing protein [Tricharina praecox]KAI5846812.1 triose-phosphate transporter family-domain-containing protein [Tricharina praecox]
MAASSAQFPAPTIPYPPSSSSGEEEDADDPLRLSLRQQQHSTRSNKRGTYANRVHPPTPSLLTTASADHETTAVSSRVRHAGTGIDVERWMSDSESEELEMDSYHGRGAAASDDEEVGRRKPRGVRHRAGDESEEAALIQGDILDDEVTRQEKKEADGRVMRDLAINLILIGLWYLFSLLISVYNKWMFSPDHLNFHFPLFTTCVHMIVQFSLSSLVLYALPQFRPVGFFGEPDAPEDLPSVADAGGSESRFARWFRFNSWAQERKKAQQGVMTKWVYMTKIAPCGAATGLDIGLGNMSLKYITLAFYTMCKSSSLAFVLVFAFAFRLEKVTLKLIGIIGVMTIGVVMMVASEAQFVTIGFILVLMASALSGLRWSLTQMLLLHNPATGNPFSSIFFLAPCMFVSILAVAIPVEGFGPLFERFGELVDQEGVIRAVAIVVFPGVIAFLMVSSEFALLKRSSVVTLSICGIFKEVMTISAAAIIFDDPLTPVNISGLLVTIVSIAAYNYIKISKMRREAVEATHRRDRDRAGAAAGAVAPTG